MPNHVTNEVVFRIPSERQEELLVGILGADGKVDFSVLLPIPLNAWQGSAGIRHEKAFKIIALDWCRENWGTKWNAYDQEPIEQTDSSLRLVFDTAWRPPYGWLCAVFNRFQVSFDYNWYDEGDNCSHVGRFDWSRMDDMGGEPWTERVADPGEYYRMRVLKWGQEFVDQEDALVAQEAGNA